MSYTADWDIRELCVTCRDREDCPKLENLDKVANLNGLNATYIVTKCNSYRDSKNDGELPIFTDLK